MEFASLLDEQFESLKEDREWAELLLSGRTLVPNFQGDVQNNDTPQWHFSHLLVDSTLRLQQMHSIFALVDALDIAAVARRHQCDSCRFAPTS